MSFIIKSILYFTLILFLLPAYTIAQETITAVTDTNKEKVQRQLIKGFQDMSCVDGCPENEPFYYYAEAEYAIKAIEAIMNTADTKQKDSVNIININNSLIVIEVKKFNQDMINSLKRGTIPCVDSAKLSPEKLENQFVLRVVINKKITNNYIPIETFYTSSLPIFQTNKKNKRTYDKISASDDVCFNDLSDYLIRLDKDRIISDKNRVVIATNDIKTLESALMMYKLNNGKYPTTEQGLQALVEKLKLQPIPNNWNPGGYLSVTTIPNDPWGNDYIYKSPAESIKADYEIISLGADGKRGGEKYNADITTYDIK